MVVISELEKNVCVGGRTKTSGFDVKSETQIIHQFGDYQIGSWICETEAQGRGWGASLTYR